MREGSTKYLIITNGILALSSMLLQYDALQMAKKVQERRLTCCNMSVYEALQYGACDEKSGALRRKEGDGYESTREKDSEERKTFKEKMAGQSEG